MAKRDIFISADTQETRVAVREDRRLEEYYVERKSDERIVGSVYKGKVTSVVPGIGAAFVDIGVGKNGFLYVSDVIEPEPEDEDAILDEDGGEERGKRRRGGRHRHHRRSRIEEVLKTGQEVVVQVVKEAFGTKGARLTTHVSLPGRYMVMMANDPRLGISRRIEDGKERGRLRQILKELKFSDEAGLIIRTAGTGKQKKDLERDVRYLANLYQRIKRQSGKAKAPSCLYQEYPLAQRVIRDSFTEDVHRIVVDHKDDFHELRRFLPQLMPGVKVRLDLYRGEEPLFEKEGLNELIAGVFEKRVALPSGGSIVIEPTESLVAIDVNTGKFTGRRNLEETAFQVDKEAAVEIARQLRLRDIGGIVIIDFIDLEVQGHRKELIRTLEDALSRDRAKTNLVSFSEIYIAEITRQRMRRSVETATSQSCPYCQGRGTVKSAVTMAIEAVRQIKRVLKSQRQPRGRTVEVLVHPQVAVRLLQEDRPNLSRLEQQSRARILVLSDPSLHFEEVKVQLASA